MAAKSTDEHFSAIFESEFDYVYRSLRRLGVRPKDLDDRTHDVFVEVFRRFSLYDPSRPVRPWLFAFAFRVASVYRGSARERRELLDAPDAEPVSQVSTPEEALAREETRALVLRALEKVELSRRAVIILYELDGCSMQSVADSLEIPLHTAYSRLRVGREELTTALRRMRVNQEEAT